MHKYRKDFPILNQHTYLNNAASGILCPTLNILGEYDKMIPIREGKKLANNINNFNKLLLLPIFSYQNEPKTEHFGERCILLRERRRPVAQPDRQDTKETYECAPRAWAR